MGRLVDADALLQKFNDKGIQITFDLPVEEILGEDVDIDDFSMLVQDAVQAYRKMVIGIIQEQPTAYDVEKVITELRKSEICPKCLNNINPISHCATFCDVGMKMEMVKKGGVT